MKNTKEYLHVVMLKHRILARSENEIQAEQFWRFWQPEYREYLLIVLLLFLLVSSKSFIMLLSSSTYRVFYVSLTMRSPCWIFNWGQDYCSVC